MQFSALKLEFQATGPWFSNSYFWNLSIADFEEYFCLKWNCETSIYDMRNFYHVVFHQ